MTTLTNLKNLMVFSAIITICGAVDADYRNSEITRTDEKPKLLDFARNSDGKLKYVTQREAIEHCKNEGNHLPSARELALYSMSLGAEGILPYGTGAPYELIRADDGQFFFRWEGYQGPERELEARFIWSSSVNARFSGYAYYFDGLYGAIGYNATGTVARKHFRCAPGL